MKYFLRYSYFIGIALAFAALISLLTRGIRYELLPIFTLLAFIVKLFDDYRNYDSDKLLEKPRIKTLMVVPETGVPSSSYRSIRFVPGSGSTKGNGRESSDAGRANAARMATEMSLNGN